MDEIDLSRDLLPQHQAVLRCLGLLSRAIGPEHWCVVGGIMVLATARRAGRVDSRGEETKDGDVVVDVVAEPALLGRAIRQLRLVGYDLPADDDRRGDLARCTFVSGQSQVDVLAPDDAGPSQLDVGPDFRTIAIPGGRRALRGAELVSLRYSDDHPDAEVGLPTLPSAICVKTAAALDTRTRDHPRHAQDVTFLLACAPDPRSVREALDQADVDQLRRLDREALHDPAHRAWRSLAEDDRDRGRAALDLLID